MASQITLVDDHSKSLNEFVKEISAVQAMMRERLMALVIAQEEQHAAIAGAGSQQQEEQEAPQDAAAGSATTSSSESSRTLVQFVKEVGLLETKLWTQLQTLVRSTVEQSCRDKLEKNAAAQKAREATQRCEEIQREYMAYQVKVAMNEVNNSGSSSSNGGGSDGVAGSNGGAEASPSGDTHMNHQHHQQQPQTNNNLQAEKTGHSSSNGAGGKQRQDLAYDALLMQYNAVKKRCDDLTEKQRRFCQEYVKYKHEYDAALSENRDLKIECELWKRRFATAMEYSSRAMSGGGGDQHNNGNNNNNGIYNYSYEQLRRNAAAATASIAVVDDASAPSWPTIPPAAAVAADAKVPYKSPPAAATAAAGATTGQPHSAPVPIAPKSPPKAVTTTPRATTEKPGKAANSSTKSSSKLKKNSVASIQSRKVARPSPPASGKEAPPASKRQRSNDNSSSSSAAKEMEHCWYDCPVKKCTRMFRFDKKLNPPVDENGDVSDKEVWDPQRFAKNIKEICAHIKKLHPSLPEKDYPPAFAPEPSHNEEADFYEYTCPMAECLEVFVIPKHLDPPRDSKGRVMDDKAWDDERLSGTAGAIREHIEKFHPHIEQKAWPAAFAPEPRESTLEEAIDTETEDENGDEYDDPEVLVV